MTNRHSHPFLIAALLIAGPAAAIEVSDHMTPCAVAQALGAELTLLSGYAPPATCPRITRSLPAAGTNPEAQLGEYLPDSGTIALAADLDLTTAWGQSVLLHELVHLAQHRDNGLPDCRAAMEYEAYAAQAAYLRRNGHERDAVMLYVFGALVSTCGNPEPWMD
ncbi:DUF6647 family protein [Mameliella sediminis]|uniref:DUF6647 family protein n=1 Tax=Mameliella sediminis TaxID=2836866 RepID=UPI001C44B0BA|nr:DUF6647 family protein [Mameliella sediminis]MBY6116365.1 hypothetical protein [Antarctobacter heliothermus]MBY6145609.1 hypothetical protein [Mameliella alba]MBV7393667.1 hypothetical protein [Mameliella sediminis]MBY6160933.1 hypothetical protein [Mameliella alba]MBY6169403.1 hypothetical protein [Mameliella alba]